MPQAGKCCKGEVLKDCDHFLLLCWAGGGGGAITQYMSNNARLFNLFDL